MLNTMQKSYLFIWPVLRNIFIFNVCAFHDKSFIPFFWVNNLLNKYRGGTSDATFLSALIYRYHLVSGNWIAYLPIRFCWISWRLPMESMAKRFIFRAENSIKVTVYIFSINWMMNYDLTSMTAQKTGVFSDGICLRYKSKNTVFLENFYGHF